MSWVRIPSVTQGNPLQHSVARDFLFGSGSLLKVSIELSRLRFLQLLGDLRTFKIEEQWSPLQISDVLKKEGTSVSHQRIYNIINTDDTRTLAQHTRHKLKYRRRPKHKHFLVAARISIHQRAEQADGKRFGDYEMDLIVDQFGHAILTIVERSTNMLFMTKLPHGKKSEPLAMQV